MLALTDSLSTRVLFSSGVVERIWDALNGNLRIVSTFDLDRHLDHRKWPVGPGETSIADVRAVVDEGELGAWDRLRRSVDHQLDARIGFYPTAVRHSMIHGFSRERMKWFNSKTFFNKSLAWPFPRSRFLLESMVRWMYGSRRFVHPALERYLAANCSALVLGNLQLHTAQPLILGAQRLGLPIIGNIGSWDHPVGKGVVYPRCRRYLVQNRYMFDALVQHHGIDPDRITITGWPQLDVCARRRTREEYLSLARRMGLDPTLPTVMYCGNSESNAPYEVAYLRRFVSWWEEKGRKRFNLLVRPHPRYLIRDRWKEVFAWLGDKPGIGLQAPSYDDIEDLALLLQHVAAVMTNAGTILLDGIVNRRPVVCVLYDEGAPAGSRYAQDNVVGDHYRALMRSRAFYRAHDFDESIAALERALHDPAELDAARKTIVRELVGEVDGRSGDRVAGAIVQAIETAAR